MHRVRMYCMRKWLFIKFSDNVLIQDECICTYCMSFSIACLCRLFLDWWYICKWVGSEPLIHKLLWGQPFIPFICFWTVEHQLDFIVNRYKFWNGCCSYYLSVIEIIELRRYRWVIKSKKLDNAKYVSPVSSVTLCSQEFGTYILV